MACNFPTPSGPPALGLCNGASQGIALRPIFSESGMNRTLHLHAGAAAAIGMSRRLGMWKVRHLDIGLLWIQNHVERGTIKIRKVKEGYGESSLHWNQQLGREVHAQMP